MLSYGDIDDIVTKCAFGEWKFKVGRGGDHAYLQVGFDAPCARTGKVEFRVGRKWRLSDHMTKSEVVHTALKAVLTAVEHEAREKFTYRGKPIFGPHFNVDKLVELCETGEHEEVRS